ncbi:DUF6168 family protein [Bizionia sediminis]|uniref:DUF6168 family protein n=2 Tax=Bizionia sediminis TaxID=1737064 RepID=A0ABW5KSZ6_9FLAO
MLILFAALFAVSYTLHSYLSAIELSFSLFYVYLFHAIAATIVYVSVELVAENLPTQAGNAYLVLMCFKLGLFLLIFREPVFENDALTMPERIALVIPLFVFLLTEAIAVGKLLNSK